MLTHLPALQVMIPLIGAPLCLLFFRVPKLSWLLAVILCFISFSISVSLAQSVHLNGTIIYEMGGWPAPWGIEYRIDHLNALLLVIISGIGSIILMAAQSSIEREIPPHQHVLFYVLFLTCFSGMLGIVITGDVFNVFVFLEISSLSTYALIALGRKRQSLWASYQYLIMGTLGATFILIGIGLMYQMTGTLNMEDLSIRLSKIEQSRTVTTALVFIIIGISMKLALFPLHIWLPNAYTFAPSIVTAFFAATSTKVAAYLLIRFSYSVFDPSHTFTALPLQTLFLVLGILGILFMSISATYQKDVKQIFAYSSIAQVGYIIVGFSLGTAAGLTAAILHIFNHALIKSALFLALAAVAYRIGSTKLIHFQGLGAKMPLTMTAIIIGSLSLIGTPLTAGFISKWFLIVAIIEQGWWIVAFILLIGSILAIYYVWRIIEATYFKKSLYDNTEIQEAPLSILIPVWILVFANIYFGIDTRFGIYMAESAAHALMGSSMGSGIGSGIESGMEGGL